MAKTAAKISLHNKSDTDGGIALKPRGNKQALTAAAAPMDLDTPAPKVGFLDGLKSVAVGLVGGGSSNGHVLIEKKSSLQPINQDDIDTEPDTREEEEEDDSTVEEARGQQKPAASPAKKPKAVAPVAEPAVVAMDTSSPVAEEEKPQAAKEEKKKKPKKASTKGKSKSKKKEAAATASDEPEKAAGRDKPKGGKGLGKDNKLPAPKRHGKKPKRPNIDSVLCGKALKGLARRGGVRRMRIGSTAEMKVQLKKFLGLIIPQVVEITSHAKRVTVTPEDVAYALKRSGFELWGGGIKDAKRKPKEGGGDAVAAKKEAHAAAAASEPTTATASADKAVHA
jgi:histone H4